MSNVSWNTRRLLLLTAPVEMAAARDKITRAQAAYASEDYPVADNATETNRARNRRVEIDIAENDQPVKSRR